MHQRWLYAVLVLIVAAFLGGCANLAEVRDFAGESARLATYTDLTTRFRDTYSRERPYLTGDTARLSESNDQARKAAYQDLLKIHDTVALYMMTLATLAGEDTFDLSKGIDSISGQIQAHPDFGVGVKEVEAATGVAKIVANWITSAKQEKAVREMVREGNQPIQELLAGMSRLVGVYRKTNENERRSVLGVFETGLPFAEGPKDSMLAALARVHVQEKTAEYAAIEPTYAAAEQGIRAIADGHQRLYDNLDRLSTDEARALLKRAADDLKKIRTELAALRS